jgi:hypothetical protein
MPAVWTGQSGKSSTRIRISWLSRVKRRMGGWNFQVLFLPKLSLRSPLDQPRLLRPGRCALSRASFVGACWRRTDTLVPSAESTCRRCSQQVTSSRGRKASNCGQTHGMAFPSAHSMIGPLIVGLCASTKAFALEFLDEQLPKRTVKCFAPRLRNWRANRYRCRSAFIHIRVRWSITAQRYFNRVERSLRPAFLTRTIFFSGINSRQTWCLGRSMSRRCAGKRHRTSSGIALACRGTNPGDRRDVISIYQNGASRY